MWRTCKENSSYSISSEGRVKNRYSKELRQYLDKYGYYYVSLGQKKYKVHRLVANNFIGDVNGFEVDHADTNRTNNSVGNLKIVTRKENANNPLSIINLKKHGERYAKLYGRKVADKLGNVYPSIIEAHRATGIPRANIQYHLKEKTGVWNYV